MATSTDEREAIVFNGKWFECAAGSQIINGVLVQAQPPSSEQVEMWLDRLKDDPAIREDVVHRYILTKRNCKNFTNWAKRTFFFRNASLDQVKRCSNVVGLTS